MNIDEAFTYVKEQRPAFVHISGKTSTGKSTFAKRLQQTLGYEVVELDKIVIEAVINPLQLTDRGLVFYEVYKMRNKPEWISSFLFRAHEILQAYQRKGVRTVIDGAVAHTTTLQELLAPFPDTEIIYLQPHNLKTYQEYLTNRFMQANKEHLGGLPTAFWELIAEADFDQFLQDHILTSALSKAIETYALSSQQASSERLKDLQTSFKDIVTVQV